MHASSTAYPETAMWRLCVVPWVVGLQCTIELASTMLLSKAENDPQASISVLDPVLRMKLAN